MSAKAQSAARGPSQKAATKRRVSVKAAPRKTKTVKKSTPQADEVAENTASQEVAVEVKKIEGIRLIRLIRKTLIERSLPERTIADIMGVTTIYWNSMANGNRKIKSLGKDKLEKVAEFLGVPTIQVYVLADYFEPADFFTTKTMDEQMWLTIVKMAEDPQWVAYAPTREEWAALPTKIRAGFAALYEREAGRVLMAKAQIEAPELFGTPE
ncbi:XRE family transcriptional regulator [Ralstonia pseudosolanacearum]|uniref:XRE family transcriptional regulator n=1 Tax=Ralstonia pseudosolanacearum TaxID=1310165 RepID=UPI003CE7492E